jgi:putative oxygen-independent coproporphyrinogen III oxidase
LADTGSKGFGLYVHWPFCLSKCPYCDFNSHVRASIDEQAYGAALVRELDTIASRMDAAPRLDSIFFGGGTPSLMPGSCVQAVIDHAEKRFGFLEGIEITLEANPTSAEAGRFQAYRAAGVNRVSLGVQALNDSDLRALGRLHSVEEAMRAVELARSVFDRVSFDLIYARPGQSLEGWEAELEQALAVGCSHYSLYQLTYEEGTPFHAALARGLMKELDPDLASAMFEHTQQRMEAAGLPAYEISNHARPGEGSRHNLLYWRYGDYVGIGPGAHGRISISGQRTATETERSPERWLGRVSAEGQGVTKWDPVSLEDQFSEALLMGLRLREGIDLPWLENRCGRSLSRDRIGALAARDLLAFDGQTLATTKSGRLVLNAILKALLV